MKKHILTAVSTILLLSLFACGSSAPASRGNDSSDIAQPFFNGDGGKGKSIAILAPQATGLMANQDYIPALVQGELVSNFSGYSAISILDREHLDEQYAELLSGYYADDAEAGLDLGHLPPTDYIMGGNITKTASGYALQINITRSADKITAASYSGTFTFAELDNLSGVRRASLDLLQKMGIVPTERTRTELAGAAESNHVNAQTALARGIVAQQGGTEVAALSYFFQATTFDPSLLEATNRATVLNTTITSGNIGADIRNDIAWRREWVNRLTETEEFFNRIITTADPPYTLFYSTGIEWGDIDYKTETANLSIPINLHASVAWFNSVQQALQAVYTGLNATERKNDWGLSSWPQQSVSKNNFFAVQKQYDISIVFELVNEQNMAIGRETVRMNPIFSFAHRGGGRIGINYPRNTFNTVTFNTIKVNDISDNLTIRIASVNGAVPGNARFLITALSESKWLEYYNSDHNHLRIEDGIVTGFVESITKLKNLPEQYRSNILPADSWGGPSGIISISFQQHLKTWV